MKFRRALAISEFECRQMMKEKLCGTHGVLNQDPNGLKNIYLVCTNMTVHDLQYLLERAMKLNMNQPTFALCKFLIKIYFLIRLCCLLICPRNHLKFL